MHERFLYSSKNHFHIDFFVILFNTDSRSFPGLVHSRIKFLPQTPSCADDNRLSIPSLCGGRLPESKKEYEPAGVTRPLNKTCEPGREQTRRVGGRSTLSESLRTTRVLGSLFFKRWRSSNYPSFLSLPLHKECFLFIYSSGLP